VTGERDEGANRRPPLHHTSEPTPAAAHSLHAGVVAYEAITPAVVSFDPMIVIDARGNEVDPKLGARAQEEQRDTQPQSSVLNVDELAALLRVNRKTVYDALSRGQIPGARRIGGRYRILRHAVLGWLADGQGRASRPRGSR
jgi:excisionase family DNA binding protein